MRREPVARNGNSYLIETNNQLNNDTGTGTSRAFYKLPKYLFTDEHLGTLSLGAKVLYAFMLDRMSLSRKNGWHDENGRTYIIFTLGEVMRLLHVTNKPAANYMNELIAHGLVFRRMRGKGQAPYLYVRPILAPSGDTPCGDVENVHERGGESPSVHVEKVHTNKTDRNKTKRSNAFNRGMVQHDDHRTPEQELDDLYRERYGCTLSEMQAGLRTGGGA